MQEAHLELNRAIWDKFGPSIRRTALPRWGPLAPPEDELKLLGNLRGQRVLELGCGDGGSLVWLAEAGAASSGGSMYRPRSSSLRGSSSMPVSSRRG